MANEDVNELSKEISQKGIEQVVQIQRYIDSFANI